MRHDFLNRIYKLKVTLVAVITLALGVTLLLISHDGGAAVGWPWIAALPVSELGSTLVVTGAFAIVWDYYDGRDRKKREETLLRRVLKESAPAFRDAVVQGFALHSQDLARVATPALLDDLANNSLALRLGDRQLATEVYADIRDQVIASEERWHDARISVNLSVDESGPAGAERFIATVTWEYTVVPKYHERTFVCVSDRNEYVDIAQDANGVSAWYIKPRAGIDASAREAFELVQFTVDGQEQRIRRSVRSRGQTYAVSINRELIENDAPVRVAYTYRTLTAQNGHLLHIDLEHPTRGVTVSLNYGDCGIAHVSVLDMIASASRPRVQRSAASVPGKSVSVELAGWAFPRAGVGFVWTLERESSATRAHVLTPDY